jgi:hypothetical protein
VVETMTLTHMILRWIHISMGLVGILSGAAALVFRKGSRPHQLVGHVFFVSMLIMASMGATLAMTYSPNRGNVMGGGLTFYMVATAWAKFLLEHLSTMLHRPSFVCALTCDDTDGPLDRRATPSREHTRLGRGSSPTTSRRCANR